MKVTSIFFEEHFKLVAVVIMEKWPLVNVQKMEYPLEFENVVIGKDWGKNTKLKNEISELII